MMRGKTKFSIGVLFGVMLFFTWKSKVTMDFYELKRVNLESVSLTTSTFTLSVKWIHLWDPHWYMLDSLNRSNQNSRFNWISHWITPNKMPIKNLAFPLIRDFF